MYGSPHESMKRQHLSSSRFYEFNFDSCLPLHADTCISCPALAHCRSQLIVPVLRYCGVCIPALITGGLPDLNVRTDACSLRVVVSVSDYIAPSLPQRAPPHHTQLCARATSFSGLSTQAAGKAPSRALGRGARRSVICIGAKAL